MDRLNQILATWPFVPLAPLPTAVKPGGRLKRPVRAVLFDVYGTLLVSRAGDIATAGHRMPDPGGQTDPISRLGLDIAPEQLRANIQAHIRAVHHARRAEGVDVPEVEIDRIWMDILPTANRGRARQAALTYELAVNPVWPMPHARQVLDVCRRCGLVVGIVSNAQFYTPLVLERLMGASLDALGFAPALRFYSYQLGRAKPSPALFDAARAALARMAIDPAATLYVGNDMGNDVWAAHRAGLQTALFAGDARSLRLRVDDPRCADLEPDLVLTDLSQLEDHFQSSSKESAP